MGIIRSVAHGVHDSRALHDGKLVNLIVVVTTTVTTTPGAHLASWCSPAVALTAKWASLYHHSVWPIMSSREHHHDAQAGKGQCTRRIHLTELSTHYSCS